MVEHQHHKEHIDRKNATSSILVVDNETDSLRLLHRILSENGYSVRAAVSGSMAWKSAQLEVPDLILLDIGIPDSNGFELYRRLKADHRTKDVPIIFMSGMKEPSRRLHELNVDCVELITKPFQIEEVLAQINTHITFRKIRQQFEK